MKIPSPERWQLIKSHLDDLADLLSEEREAFLDQLSRKDPVLFRQVEVALEANREDRAFLEDQPFAVLLRDIEPHEITSTVELIALQANERVGPYRLMREMGHGGMGEVYLAERADGAFEQQVALKLVKRGLGSQAVHHRFLAERQILARLQHDKIARLLDGGMTDQGQPYFVMELVDGVPITAYCDLHQLGIEARLKLFGGVCEAVQYAHSNLVVHRDLKPSNILVVKEGQVKLLDFGIAKLLSEEAPETTSMTQTDWRVMTPEYAAPEQVQGDVITTATDVYALGLLLYELLTGRRPYRLQGRGQAELERVICHMEPEAPSMVVGKPNRLVPEEGESATPEDISRKRGLSVEKLKHRLSGDLDTMVLKALRKEPKRRYPSAEAFLEDIKRHLTGLPVSAQPDTLGYRVRKFIGRHRRTVAVGMAALVVLAGIIGYYTGRLARERDRAQAEASKLREVKEYLVGLFEVSDPWKENNGQETTARELLDRGLARIETLQEEPEVQAEMLHVLGVVYRQLSRYEEARPLLEQALTQRREQLGEEHPDVAQSLYDLGALLEILGNYDEAEDLLRASLHMRRRLPDNHANVAESLRELGWVRRQQGAYDEAEHLLREALGLFRTLHTDEHPSIAESLNDLAIVLVRKGNYEEADHLHREALEMRRKLHGEEHPSVAQSLNSLAVVLEKKGEYDEAEDLHRAALAMRRKLHGEEHPAVAIDMDNLAIVLQKKGNYNEAEQLTREAMHLFRKLFGNEHPDVGISMFNLALILEKKGNYDEAEQLHREALAMGRKLLGDQHPSIGKSLYGLSTVLHKLGRCKEAEPLLQEALDLSRRLGETYRRTVQTKRLLGICFTVSGQYEEAEALLLESLAIYEQENQEEERQKTQQALSDLYMTWGRFERGIHPLKRRR